MKDHNMSREVTLFLEAINDLFELNDKDENPALYMYGREQEYLDKIAAQPTNCKVILHKQNLKKKCIILLDIAAKFLLSTLGSLEQVSKNKLQLMVDIEDFTIVEFNWLKLLVDHI